PREEVGGSGSITGGLSPVNPEHPSSRNTTYTECRIHRQCARRDRVDLTDRLIAHPHDCTFSILLLDLLDLQIKGLVLAGIVRCHITCHVSCSSSSVEDRFGLRRDCVLQEYGRRVPSPCHIPNAEGLFIL